MELKRSVFNKQKLVVDYTVNKISIMGKELKLKIPTNEEPNFDLAVVYDLGTESGRFLSCPFPINGIGHTGSSRLY